MRVLHSWPQHLIFPVHVENVGGLRDRSWHCGMELQAEMEQLLQDKSAGFPWVTTSRHVIDRHHEAENRTWHTRIEWNDGAEGSERQSFCHGGRSQPCVIARVLGL